MKIALLWLAFCAMLGGGISVRRWAWNHTEDIRFHFDINNGFTWGLIVNRNEQIDYTRAPTWGEFFAGYRGLYQREEYHPSRSPKLDYSPFRLLIMGLWAKSVLAVDPTAGGWIDRDANPLLWLNTICALTAAIGVYFLLRLWLRRRAGDQPLHPPRNIELRCIFAAACLWFNPAVLIDAHIWPQWDIWCVPFYVWALFAGSVGAWFCAGILIGLGAMLKGQILIVAPVILIWAAFSNRRYGMIHAALAALGTLTAGVLVGSLWLVPDAHAWLWVGPFILLAILAGIIFSRAVRRYWIYYSAAIVCLGIILGCWFFHGSLAWLACSFINSTDDRLRLDPNAINLSAILNVRYGWELEDIVFSFPTHWLGLNDGVSIKWTMRGIYIITLLLCGIAAAVQTRRRSPRALIALAAPWVLMYALLPQMHERYLVWGAAITAIAVGVDLELFFPFLLVTAIASANILFRLHLKGALGNLIFGMVPDIGWVTTLVALVYLYQAWKREPRCVDLPNPI